MLKITTNASDATAGIPAAVSRLAHWFSYNDLDSLQEAFDALLPCRAL